jgi:hypothetical protein
VNLDQSWSMSTMLTGSRNPLDSPATDYQAGVSVSV